MRPGRSGPHRVIAETGGTGAYRAGVAYRGTAHQAVPLPRHKEPGQLRLPGPTFPQQAPGAGVGSLRVHRPWENIIALGNSGIGKTHVALGLGLAACQKGFNVGFTTASALVHELIEVEDKSRLLQLRKRLVGLKLLIIDELGFVPLSKTGAELLF